MNKNTIKIAFIYVGTIIGAGFASGREIIDFFGIYGVKGITGMFLSGILFSIIGAYLLIYVYKNRIRSYKQLINKLFQEKLGIIIDAIITFSLFTGFTIMVAGSGAIFQQEMGLSYNVGVLVMLISCFVVFLFSLEGLSFINSILVPLLIIGILFSSVVLASREGFNFSNIEGLTITSKGNFITSSLLYVGFNLLVLIVVFSSLLPMIDNKRTAILSGIMGGVILAILGTSILISSLIFYNEVYTLDIPMIRISNYISEGYRKVYGVILWIAMFTTALANGFGFIERLKGKNHNKIFIPLILCLSSIPLTKLGFSKLVGIIYPFFGYIGFILFIIILFNNLNRTTIKKFNK